MFMMCLYNVCDALMVYQCLMYVSVMFCNVCIMFMMCVLFLWMFVISVSCL